MKCKCLIEIQQNTACPKFILAKIFVSLKLKMRLFLKNRHACFHPKHCIKMYAGLQKNITHKYY